MQQGVSRAGQVLADVLLDPTNMELSTAERCKAAGISVSRYFNLIHDDNFQSYLRARGQALLAPALSAIQMAAIKCALSGDRDGFKDREMLLKMGTWFQPVQKQEISGPGGGPVTVQFIPPPGSQTGARGRVIDIDPGTGSVLAQPALPVVKEPSTPAKKSKKPPGKPAAGTKAAVDKTTKSKPKGAKPGGSKRKAT